jgi:transglutaminase-like putative cysteine protease
MKYAIQHTTEYLYSQTVMLCHNEAHLKPRDQPGQHCERFELEIDPLPAHNGTRLDYLGNPVHYFTIQQPHVCLKVTAISEVHLELQSTYQDNTIDWLEWVSQFQCSGATSDLVPRFCRLDSGMARVSKAVADYAATSFKASRSVYQAVADLNQRIYNDFTYAPGMTSITTPLETILKHRQGVCQDLAHLAIACCRSVGLPARYVSGYLETLPPEGQTKLKGSDASHAWFEVYVGEGLWLGFDPTNDCLTSDQHIMLAWGRDYHDVTPLKGQALGGGESHHIRVAVDVERLPESNGA